MICTSLLGFQCPVSITTVLGKISIVSPAFPRRKRIKTYQNSVQIASSPEIRRGPTLSVYVHIYIDRERERQHIYALFFCQVGLSNGKSEINVPETFAKHGSIATSSKTDLEIILSDCQALPHRCAMPEIHLEGHKMMLQYWWSNIHQFA